MNQVLEGNHCSQVTQHKHVYVHTKCTKALLYVNTLNLYSGKLEQRPVGLRSVCRTSAALDYNLLLKCQNHEHNAMQKQSKAKQRDAT